MSLNSNRNTYTDHEIDGTIFISKNNTTNVDVAITDSVIVTDSVPNEKNHISRAEFDADNIDILKLPTEKYNYSLPAEQQDYDADYVRLDATESKGLKV